MVSATVAPTRLTDPSSASESRPTESVSHHAAAFRTIVASAATMESSANLRAPAGFTSGRRRCGRRERVGIELVLRQPPLGGEVAARGVNHHGCAAGIDLVGREVGEILHHRAMDEAGATGPVVRGKRVREDRHVAQVSLALPTLGELVEIEVGAHAAAPIKRYRALRSLVEGVLDDRFDWR